MARKSSTKSEEASVVDVNDGKETFKFTLGELRFGIQDTVINGVVKIEKDEKTGENKEVRGNLLLKNEEGHFGLTGKQRYILARFCKFVSDQVLIVEEERSRLMSLTPEDLENSEKSKEQMWAEFMANEAEFVSEPIIADEEFFEKVHMDFGVINALKGLIKIQ